MFSGNVTCVQCNYCYLFVFWNKNTRKPVLIIFIKPIISSHPFEWKFCKQWWLTIGIFNGNVCSIFSQLVLKYMASYYTPSLLWPMLVKEWQTMGNKIAIFQLFYSMVLIYDILPIFQTIYESVTFCFLWSICHAFYKNLTIVYV